MVDILYCKFGFELRRCVSFVQFINSLVLNKNNF